jgi:protein-serine/threonine kinase
MKSHLHPQNINHLHDAECVKCLGKGSHGTVKLYQCKEKVGKCQCNQYFVVKHIRCNKSKYNNKLLKKTVLNEYTIGSLLHHPYIRETLDVDLECNALIFEYCPGIDFFNFIKYTHPSVKDEILYFKQLIDGVDYMHKTGIAHMDLKLENIMVDNIHKTIKIIDFGNSKVFHDSLHINTVIPEKGIHGSLPYIAPEEFLQVEYNPEKTDVWASGIILFEIVYHSFPWHQAENNDHKFRYYLHSLRCNNLRNIFPEEISRVLLSKMLNPNPDYRPRIEEIKEDLKDLDKIEVHFNSE